ncbi:helix-turn-helix domain-containing protein [Zavarzinia sp.]|uniref:helix-turn-helix domain-containing protein n=1 Tax=Zavarzinia sp. TaxID=2027920 RepID=UPI003BB61833
MYPRPVLSPTDLAAVERYRARLAAGEEEALPADMVSRMIDSESPLKLWREHRGLSARALADRAGLSPAYVSQIETGKREGSISAMKALAGALNVGLDDLV